MKRILTATMVVSLTLFMFGLVAAAFAVSAGDYIVTEHPGKLSVVTPGGVRTVIYDAADPYRMFDGVAIDSAGNYIVIDDYLGVDLLQYSTLARLTPGGVETAIYYGGFYSYYDDVAIDNAGNFIVTRDLALLKITPSGVMTVLYDYNSHGLNIWPKGLTVDSAGNYIVAEGYAGMLSKITPGGVRTVLYSFAANIWPYGVAIDSAGNYIVAEGYAGMLSKITPGGVRTVLYSFATGTDPLSVVIDSAGNYIVTANDSTLSKITPGGVRTVLYSFASGTFPWDVAIVPGPTGYSATIWSWCASDAWLSLPITMDGAPTGYSTPHTFTNLTGTHTFTMPSTDLNGDPFYEWSTGSTTKTLTVSSDGVYTARYKPETASLTVKAPNGGELWPRGTTRTITWSSAGSPGANVKIELLKGGVLNRVIAPSTANDGSHPWLIPAAQALGSDYRIRITSTTNPAITDSSNATFAITVGSLTVKVPNGGEQWPRGTTRTITWSSAGSPGANVKIELLKGGVLNRVITPSTANDGSHPWLIPAAQALGSDYRIRITSTTNPGITDSSNANFAITVGSLTVKVPNGGELWPRGTTRTITWSSAGSPGANVKIELLKGGVLNKVITPSTANDGAHPWLIPAAQALGGDYRIRIKSTTNPGITDSSNANFAVTN